MTNNFAFAAGPPVVRNGFEQSESEFSFIGFPNAVMDALRRGLEALAVQLAVTFGERDGNKLTNLVFFWRHRDRNGRKLEPSEPNFAQLSLEWRDTQGELVIPAIARATAQIRFFSCDADDLQGVRTHLGKTVTVDQLRVALDQSVRSAVIWTLRAAYALERAPRRPNTNQLFGEVFGVCPTHLPSEYVGVARKWKDYGELVALRLRAAARTLQEGWVKFHCWNGRKHCLPVPGFAQCAPPEQHYACFGANSHLCLGGSFWDRWNENNNLSLPTMASTLVHESLHIYFHHLGHSGRIVNTNCYEVFLLRHNSLPVHPDTANACTTRAVICA